MTRPTRLVVALLVLAVVAWSWWHFTRPAATPAHVARVPSLPPGEALPVESVLLVRPATSKVAPASTPAASARAISPELAQFRARRDYAALYRALEAAPSTPESLYLRAGIYAACARPAGKSAEDVARERVMRREQLVAGLAQGVSTAAQRIDAFDRLNSDACKGLDLGAFDAEALARMVAAAAEAGDVRARAWQLAERIEWTWQGRQVAGEQHGYEVGATDFDEARRLLATNDPDVIVDLQGILSSTLARGSIRLGNQPVDQAAFHTALTLLACDAGAPCGADSPMLLQNCAARGRCAAGSVYDYLYYYENSPADAQLIDSYRRTLQAMLNGGDLSALTWSPLPPVPGFSMVFGGRRSGRPGG